MNRLYKVCYADKQEKGFVGLYLAILVLLLTLGIAGSIGFRTIVQQKVAQNAVQSAQAYYAAESGAEDALLRVAKPLAFTEDVAYTFSVGSAAAEATISSVFSGTRNINAQGDSLNRIRKATVVYEIEGNTPGFFYGAQVGHGGLVMENNSQVIGNVFSNGGITGKSGSSITGTVEIASAGNILKDLDDVGGDAFVDTCDNSAITGVLHGNSQSNCTSSSFDTPYTPSAPLSLPIPESQITAWKNDAAAGGTIGTQTIDASASLGPIKIAGDLVVKKSGTVLDVTGTIWVTGDITIDNNATVELDSSYGTTSGVIISDKVITLQNNSISRGSGSAGSYLMHLSTFSGGDAIVIKQNAQADIVYTNNGTILVDNNGLLREVTGYGIKLQPNSIITYDVGLSSATFTSGPSGGWSVTSWKEVP